MMSVAGRCKIRNLPWRTLFIAPVYFARRKNILWIEWRTARAISRSMTILLFFRAVLTIAGVQRHLSVARRCVPLWRSIAIAIAAIGMLASASSWAATYYVDSVLINDANGGQSATAPWRSLQRIKYVPFSQGTKSCSSRARCGASRWSSPGPAETTHQS